MDPKPRKAPRVRWARFGDGPGPKPDRPLVLLFAARSGPVAYVGRRAPRATLPPAADQDPRRALRDQGGRPFQAWHLFTHYSYLCFPPDDRPWPRPAGVGSKPEPE